MCVYVPGKTSQHHLENADNNSNVLLNSYIYIHIYIYIYSDIAHIEEACTHLYGEEYIF